MVTQLINPRCPHCGQTVSRSAKFCGSCGQALSGGKVQCGNCGTENPANAVFCGHCGRSLKQSEVTELRGNHWARGENDFAARIESVDLKGSLRSGLVVEPGTNAMIIDRGENRGIFAPGAYTLERVEKKLYDWLASGVAEQATVLLVNVIPTDLEFHLGGRFSKDPLPVGLTLRLQVEVEDPGRFLVNMLAGRERLTVENLREYLYPEVVSVIDHWLAQHTLQELSEDYSLRERLELELEQALKQTFAQSGLSFRQVRALTLNLEPYDKVKGLRGSYALWQMEERVKLEGDIAKAETEKERHDFEERLKLVSAQEDVETRKRYYQIQREHDLLEMVKETDKVKDEEQRVDLYARMRRSLMSDKMDEVKSEDDFDRFLDEIDRNKLLRERERAELVRIWNEESADRDKARAHLLAKLDVEREYELRTIQLKLQHGENVQKLDNEIEIARKRADYDLESRRRMFEEEVRLNRERLQIQQEREKIENERKKGQMELARLEREQERGDDRADAMLAFELLQKMKQIRYEDDERRMALVRLDKQETLRIDRENALAIAREKQRMDVERWEIEERQRLSAREHEYRMTDRGYQHEIQRLEQIGKLGTEALVSISGAEQGRLLADLKKSEALKGMSEEQILALAAEKSPEVARAFQEKFRAIANGEAAQQVKEMYERLIAEKDASARMAQQEADKRVQGISDAWEKSSAQSQATAHEAMGHIADVAKTYAQNQPQQTGSPVIVTPSTSTGLPVVIPPGGTVPSVPGASDGAAKSCPDCGRSVPVVDHYCPFCGHAFKGMGGN